MDALGQVSTEIGKKILGNEVTAPREVKVPQGALIKRGNRVPITPLFGVVVPFTA